MGTAIPDEEAGTCHTRCEADSCNQGRTVDILLHYVAQKSGGHAEEEDSEAEGPFCCALGKTDIVGDLLAENRPAVYRTDTAVEEQCGNCRTYPFVLNFHF